MRSKKQHGGDAESDSLGGDHLVVCTPDEKHWALIPAQHRAESLKTLNKCAPSE